MPLGSPLRLIKALPLRVILAIPALLPLLLTVSLTTVLSYRNSQQAVNALASRLQQEIAAHVSQHLTQYMGIAEPLLDLSHRELISASLSPQDLDGLESYFLNQSFVFESVYQLYFGRQDGEFVGIVNLGGTTRAVNTTQIENPMLPPNLTRLGHRRLVLFTLDAEGRRGSQLSSTNYIVRQRPWYQAAIAAGETTWSEIYTWANVKTLGLTLARPYVDSQGQLQGVLGVDLGLTHINRFLRQLPVSQTGRAFILERSGLLVASSTGAEPFVRGRKQLHRITAANLDDPIIRAVAEQIQTEFGDLSRIQTPQQRRYSVPLSTNKVAPEVAPQQRHQFVQITPWQDEFGLDWLLVVAVPESEFMAQIQQNNRHTFFLTAVALLLAMGLSLLLARWISHPILQLSQAAQKLAEGEWAEPLDTSRRDEIGQLARAFDHMNQQLAAAFNQLEDRVAERTQALAHTLEDLRNTQTKLIESAKMAALGKLVAGVAHEVNTPVGTALLAASTLETETQMLLGSLSQLADPDTLADPELLNEYLDIAMECCRIILDNLQRAGDLVQSFKQIAVDQTQFQPRTFRLIQYLREVLQSLHPQISKTPHQIVVTGDEAITLTTEPGALAQIVTNLVMNSLTHAYGGDEAGQIVLTAELRKQDLNLDQNLDQMKDQQMPDKSSDEQVPEPAISEPAISEPAISEPQVILRYQDDGCGMTPEVCGRIFEPFFTTASRSQNSGLGLHLVYNLVTQRLGGAIAVSSSPGRGTTFTITLPL